MKPFQFRDLKKSRHENARPEPCTVAGEALKNPQISTSSFLIEVYFRTAPGHTGGVLMEKMKGEGYSLTVGATGKLSFHVKGASASAIAASEVKVNNGQWHHGLVEANRRARTLTVYVDGKKNGSADGVEGSVSLANDGDVYVGGTPEGRYLDGALDFLRIAQGTLSDADTTIEELFAWEFDGPQNRDFMGSKPTGARNAGAIGVSP
jgi:Concanavalin A-like lectin/glucanases superfamily